MSIPKDNPDLHIDLIDPGPYLKAADFRDKVVTLTIKSLSMEDMEDEKGENEQVLIMSFVETDKMFLVNKTNRMAFAQISGTKRAVEWAGKKIQLGPHICNAYGDPNTESIRVVDSTGKVFYKAKKAKKWIPRKWRTK